MNLFDLEIFPARVDSALQYLTLEQALRCKAPGTVLHPMGYLGVPTQMLAHAMLQWLVAQSGEIGLDEWLDAVEGSGLDDLADDLFTQDNLQKARRGFELFAPTAFMQAPHKLFDNIEGEAIEGIFQPIRARVEGNAKALRATAPMTGLCPSCAAVGLVVTHMFSGSMSQYWGSSPARGAAVYTLDVGRVGSSLVANVMHAKHPLIRNTTLKPLPWLPGADGHVGLEADGRMPFEKHLLPQGRFDHPANVSLPLIRAVRLVEPRTGDRGCCSACGRTNQPMVRRFKLAAEPAVFGQLSKATISDLKSAGEDPKPAKILASMLSPAAVHPALAYVQAKAGKGGEGEADGMAGPRPQPVYGGVDDLKAERPAWIHMLQAVGGSDELKEGTPRLIAPQVVSQLRLADVDASCKEANVAMFGVRFEGATNPNPKYVLMALYGVSHLLRDDVSAGELANMSEAIVKVVDQAIDAWVDAAQRIDYDVQDTHEGLKILTPGSKNRRAAIRGAVVQDAVLRACAKDLWALALAKVNNLSDVLLDDASTDEQVDLAKQQAIKEIKQEADRCWRRYLRSRESGETSMNQLFLEAQADRLYHYLTSDKKPAAKATKAGKAKAEAESV